MGLSPRRRPPAHVRHGHILVSQLFREYLKAQIHDPKRFPAQVFHGSPDTQQFRFHQHGGKSRRLRVRGKNHYARFL